MSSGLLSYREDLVNDWSMPVLVWYCQSFHTKFAQGSMFLSVKTHMMGCLMKCFLVSLDNGQNAGSSFLAIHPWNWISFSFMPVRLYLWRLVFINQCLCLMDGQTKRKQFRLTVWQVRLEPFSTVLLIGGPEPTKRLLFLFQQWSLLLVLQPISSYWDYWNAALLRFQRSA